MGTPFDKAKFNKIPWQNGIPQYTQDGFLFRAVKSDAWDAYYPYQLLLVHEEDGGKFTILPYRYTLPIPPEELQIQMPVADKIEPTLGGFNETHGGAPFRMISFSGTTGVLPEAPESHRNSVNDGNDAFSFATQFTQPLVNSFNTLISGGQSRITNEYSERNFPDAGTGFFYFHQLRQFLEGYIAIKGRSDSIKPGSEDDDGENTSFLGLKSEVRPDRLRLAFCMWKDNSVYICKLANFELRRSASSPLEYRYSLQLQAYRRVDIGKEGQAYETFKLPVPKKNLLTNILNRVDAVRKIVANAANLVNLGVVGPLALLSELSRQISGIIKDTLAIPRAILDMPQTFVNGVLNSVFEIQQQAIAGKIGIQESWQRLQNIGQAVEDKLVSVGFARKGPSTGGTIAAANSIQQAIQIDSQGPIGGRGNSGSDFRRPDVEGGQAMNNTNIDPAELLQEMPEISALEVTAFPLTAEQKAQLQAEIDSSETVSVADITNIRESVQQNLDRYTQGIGAWDQVYSDTYGLAPTSTTQREPTREELDIIFSINDFLLALDQFITYLQDQGGSNTPSITSVEYIAGLAERSGIEFSVPRSKFAVPFPFGATLERVALQYLGDANLWHEIAALNNLRAPYVDEVGFEYPLLVNGDTNEIVVGTRENLFTGQPIWLSSTGVRREMRRIIGIRQSSPTQTVLTLDGQPDMDRFLIAQSAVMNAFLPGTVNSRQVIYIPDEGAPSLDDNLASIPGVDPYDPLLRIGGVDWLLTPKLDLVVTPYGDNPLAIGLTAITQGAMVAFKTKKKALQQHPDWGFGLEVGSSVADLDMPSLLRDLDVFFNGDPALAGLRSVNVMLRGPTLLINAELGVRGLDRTIPILLPLDRPV